MSDLGDSQITTTYIINNIVESLFSYESTKTARTLEYYFFPNATFTSPIMKIKGVSNIQRIYAIWQLVHRKKPTINNIVFDRGVAVVHYTDHLSPRLFPSFLALDIPSITTFYFKETDPEHGSILKIYKQEDNWTIEGLLESIPVISFCYNRILRFTLGKLIIATGDLLDAAYLQADKMTSQGQELHRIGLEMARENRERLSAYRTQLQENYMRARQNY